jgi:predicted metal-dependent hydrolase
VAHDGGLDARVILDRMNRVAEPAPCRPDLPRYTRRAFPPYRFVPRSGPHPYRDAEGHSHGRGLPEVTAFPPEAWRSSEDYLFGIDLYNHAYWWEAHEVLEELWHLAGHRTQQGQFLQGLIQLAAGLLHRFSEREGPFRVQVGRGIERLRTVPSVYMGVPVDQLIQAFQHLPSDPHGAYPLILLGP